jgi:nitroimidazol reductase NimA-like FMN-containing flavoprotein (pyridoxamine 5'-phosphate oxidase superfamily)
MEFDRNGLVVLSRQECLDRLGRFGLGRVAVTVGALPVILPVNYSMLDGDVVFRCSRGTNLDAAVRNAVVAFEADQVDWFGHGGWSVLVVGTASEVTDPDEIERVRDLPLAGWVAGDELPLVRVRSQIVTGRYLSPVVRSAMSAGVADA